MPLEAVPPTSCYDTNMAAVLICYIGAAVSPFNLAFLNFV